MIKKKVVIIIVEVIIVLLFLLTVNFFYNLKMANVAVSDYQAQSDRLSGLVSKSLEAAKKAKEVGDDLQLKNIELQNTIKLLQDENTQLHGRIGDLEKSLDKLQVNASVVTPLKERLKAVMASLDSLNLSEARKDEIDNLLRKAYNELSSIDLSVAKLAKDEPLYKAIAREHEGKLQEKVEESQKIIMENYQLSQKVTGSDSEIKDLRVKIDTLTKEKDAVTNDAAMKEKEIATYQNQIAALQGERQTEVEELARFKQDSQKLAAAIDMLTKDRDGLLDSKNAIEQKMQALQGKDEQLTALQADYQKVAGEYALLQSKISANSNILSKRADRIVTLEDSVKTKSTSLVKLKDGMKQRIKELATLRDDIVRVKIENAKLKNSLVEKEKAFDELQRGIDDVNKARNKFRPAKDVNVEINDVEGQTVKQ